MSTKQPVTDPISFIGRPRKFKTPEDMQTAIIDYFKHCAAIKEYPTVTGLAFHIGLTRQSLLDYQNEHSTDNPGFLDTVKMAKEFIFSRYEQLLLQKDRPAGVIFALKNNFGWRDISELKHSGSVDHNFIISTEEMLKLQGPPGKTIEVEALEQHED
jgi:hypothetical protein